VEILSKGREFVELPPLSCGGIHVAVAIAVNESDSSAGQVLLLRGVTWDGDVASTVQLVDLVAGVCTLQPALLQTLTTTIPTTMTSPIPPLEDDVTPAILTVPARAGASTRASARHPACALVTSCPPPQ
jgi:hypothetical protein